MWPFIYDEYMNHGVSGHEEKEDINDEYQSKTKNKEDESKKNVLEVLLVVREIF